MITIRRARQLAAGDVDLLDLGADLVALEITTGSGITRVVVNLGEEAWPIPRDSTLLIASQPYLLETLPSDHAVWLTVP